MNPVRVAILLCDDARLYCRFDCVSRELRCAEGVSGMRIVIIETTLLKACGRKMSYKFRTHRAPYLGRNKRNMLLENLRVIEEVAIEKDRRTKTHRVHK
jgi:hypothetical protein